MAATTKGPYDPIKAVEGMFNGSVTRIAYALKDPAGYSGSTKTVLAECAKRFHDALDDCEIQLLDAKWYLEQQLRTNRMRRAAKAREIGTAAKRKHDEIKDTNEAPAEDQTPAKKAKTDEIPVKAEAKKEDVHKAESASTSKSTQSKTSTVAETREAQPKQSQERPIPQEAEDKARTEQGTQPAKPPPPAEPTQKPAEPAKITTKDAPPPEDFPKPTPQATPTGTNDDFNFESMFGEATNDLIGDSSKDDNDLNFDFAADDFGGVNDADPNSLDSLLPGLESYANQTDDNMLSMSMNAGTDAKNNVPVANAADSQDASGLPSLSNDFDLPSTGGPNIFDEFFNDDSLGGIGGSGGNFEDNIDLSDQALLDLDFDSIQ